MIEVLSSFSCTTHTFFVAVDIMDRYFARSSGKQTRDIHLIGVTCMLIASKLEEIIPFKVKTVVQKMTHGKIPAKDILKCEFDILTTLDFKFIDSPNLFAVIEILLVKLDLHKTPMIDDIFKVSTYISKMILHDYSLITRFETKYLASSCIYITFKIIEQVCAGFRTKQYVDVLKTTLSLKEQKFYNSSELILALAKNFERVFSFAKNLMKFDSFSLDKKNQYFSDENGHYKLKIQKENLPTKKTEKTSRRKDKPEAQNTLKEAADQNKPTTKKEAERAKAESKKAQVYHSKNDPTRQKNNENLLLAKNMNSQLPGRYSGNMALSYKNMNLNGTLGKLPKAGTLGRMPLTGNLGQGGKMQKGGLIAKKKGSLKENALKRF